MSQIILCITVDCFEIIIITWGRNLGESILGVHCINHHYMDTFADYSGDKEDKLDHNEHEIVLV